MNIPDSMRDVLAAWNNGAGIDLETWIGCEGNFSLAVGYASLFWPEFVQFERYILRSGFSEAGLRGFENQPDSSRKSIEWVMNHLHLADLQYGDCEDITPDKLILLGNILKEIHEAKLKWQFPSRPCIVEFHIPEDEEDLDDYQLSFWQVETEAT